MRKWYPAALIVVMAIVSVLAYPHLPDQVPKHWSFGGQPNGYWSRNTAVIAGPLGLAALWAILRFLPSTDPRRANYDRMRGTYDLLVNAILTLVAAFHFAGLAYALGMSIEMRRVIPAVLGVVLIIVGNVLPRARPNWWFGIRTPWTLSSDRVWARTHRFGGYVVTACGVAALIIAIVGIETTPRLGLAIFVVAGAIITVYSYIAWTQEQSR